MNGMFSLKAQRKNKGQDKLKKKKKTEKPRQEEIKETPRDES